MKKNNTTFRPEKVVDFILFYIIMRERFLIKKVSDMLLEKYAFELNKKLAHLDQQFDSLGQKFDSLGQKFDSLDQKVDSLPNKFLDILENKGYLKKE
ncbi:MAG: hypothetical protein GY828_03280 [Candidatus Gracilibacteria bacterium]|nr:hypothetical protein [Candidatus Gracilibacteria bacterium]